MSPWWCEYIKRNLYKATLVEWIINGGNITFHSFTRLCGCVLLSLASGSTINQLEDAILKIRCIAWIMDRLHKYHLKVLFWNTSSFRVFDSDILFWQGFLFCFVSFRSEAEQCEGTLVSPWKCRRSLCGRSSVAVKFISGWTLWIWNSTGFEIPFFYIRGGSAG